MNKMSHPCHRCQERDGVHEMQVTKAGTLGPLYLIWYCEPCYQYLKQEAEKNNICHGWGSPSPTVIVGSPPPQPLEIPAVIPVPKFVGDKPLPDIRSILANNPIKNGE